MGPYACPDRHAHLVDPPAAATRWRHLTPETDTTPAASPDPTSLDFNPTFVPVNEALRAGQRWSTWNTVERGARGPHPRPQWVVTDDSAVDTELGVLNTGKEADDSHGASWRTETCRRSTCLPQVSGW
ncbi:hypothetical protein BH24ACT11_BH24ACT11_01030 [soil metagenome]